MANTLKRFFALILSAVMVLGLIPLGALAEDAGKVLPTKGTALTGHGVNGLHAEYDTGSWSVLAAASIRGNVKTSNGQCGNTTVTGTLTLTNEMNAKAMLSFNWALNPNYGTLKINGTSVSGSSGSRSIELAAGASATVSITSADSNNGISSGITVTLSNISLEIIPVNATVTFQPGEHGSFTLDGVPVTSTVTRTQLSTIPFVLAATPDDGYEFYGWYNVTGSSYISTDNPASLNIENNITIRPTFIPEGRALFRVGSNYYLDLNQANTAASSANPKLIVLVGSGMLPAGNYTISSGVTLLIPYDAESTVVNSISTSTNRTYITPYEYSRLTLADGANITVSGSISVAAEAYSMSGGGKTVGGGVTGPYGRIDMLGGSSITLNSGAYLYGYGYVTGDGSITAKNGSTVKECFQITEFRGGTALSSLNNNSQKVFPISQYYVQNIEAPITFEYGSSEKLDTTLFADGNPNTVTDIKFIGPSGCLFTMSSGASATKRYDPREDRLIIDIDGSASLSAISMTLIITMTSSKYVLPISNNITLNIHSGTTTIPNAAELLPGVRVKVDSGATVTLNSNVNLFVYDSTEWLKATNGYDVYFGYLGDIMPLPYTPTRAHNRTSADLHDVLVDVNGTVNISGNFMTTAGGANITSSEGTGRIVMNKVGSATLYQCSQSGSDVSYHQVSVTSAKLKNGEGYEGTDEEYVATASCGTGTYLYSKEVEKWYKFKVDYKYNGNVIYTDYTATGSSTYTASGMSFTSASATNGTASVSGGTVSVTGISGNSTVTLNGTAVQYVPVFVLDEKNAALYQNYTGSALSETVTIGEETFWVVRRDSAAAFGSSLSAPSDASMGVNSSNHNSIVWKLANTTSSEPFNGYVPAGTGAGGEAYIYGIYSGAVASVTSAGSTAYFPTLKEAFNAVPGSGESTVTLLADCGSFESESSVESYAVLGSASVTFDLNGHAAVGSINNKGTLNIDLKGGSLDYHTDWTEGTAFNSTAAIINSGNLTVTDTAGGGFITTDAATTSSDVAYRPAVIRNTGVMAVSNVTLSQTQVITGSYETVILNYNGARITSLDHVTAESSRYASIYNYGSSIDTIDSCSFSSGYGIYNRNLRNSNSISLGYAIGKPAVIGLIKDSTFTVGQYAINNGGVISTIDNCTFTAHPDSAQVNTLGTADNNFNGNVQCYTVYNTSTWWYDTNVWRRTDVTSGAFNRTDEFMEDESCRPTIGTINNCRIYAENTSTSADHGCALFNNGGVIGTISGNTEIKTYKHPSNGSSVSSNYALRNTAGGIIHSIEGSVEIRATGCCAIYNDGQFTTQTFNEYGNKIGGVQTHNHTVYGEPSTIGSINCTGTIAAGTYYGIFNSGYVGSITGGVTISANYNVLLNSGAGAASEYDYVRTYTNNTDSATETKRFETYERNLEKGGVIDSINGVHFVGTGSNSYYLLQNQGAIGAIRNSDFTAASPRAGEGYAMFMNGDSRQSGNTLTREPFAYGSLFITPYDYHYDYDIPVIGEMDNVTITKNATYAFRNLGVINTLKNSSISGTQYVFNNVSYGPYVSRDYVRYYSGTTKFATTKNNGSDLTSAYQRIPSEIGSIDNCTFTGTSTYTFVNSGHVGELKNSTLSSSNTNVLYNGGSTILSFTSNILDIISEVTATTSACTVVYGNQSKVNVTDYQAPSIGLIGAGTHISGTYQALVNLGDITAIDGGSDPVTITSTTQKQVGGIYSYTGTLDARTATTPYTDGTAGTTVNEDTYLNAHIGSIKNTIITANGIGIQNGSANATYLPVIDELGEGLEVNANCTTAGYHAVYNTDYAKIASITGGIYTAAKATTNAYKNNNTVPDQATLISGGDFKGAAATRANAVFEPDNTNRQTYPSGKGLVGPRTATLHNGTSSDGYYFIGNAYTVTWMNGSTQLEQDIGVPEGTIPSYDGTEPSKPDDANYTYTFVGWAASPDQEEGVPASQLPAVTADVTYYAAFSKAVKGYTVIWKNWDGSILETDTNVPEGAMPSYDGAEPTRQGSAQYTYTFAGWDPAVSPVTADITYTAVFTETVNTYTVIWNNDDGTLLEKDEGVAYGSTPSYDGATPTKAATAQYTYTFSGWTPAVAAVTGNVTYTATYTQTVNTYTVTWKNEDGSVLDTETYEYGATPEYKGETPAKPGDAQYSYMFDGWTPAITPVTGNAVYTATFTAAVNTYTVTWNNYDGTALEIDEGVEYGASPSYDGASPTRAADPEFTYTFSGWSPEPAPVTGNVTYTAQFTAAKRSYTITWLNDDDTVIDTTTVEYGAVPEHADPVKAPTAQYTYTFAGWDPAVTAVTGSATYKATYTATVNKYAIRFVNYDGTELQNTLVEYGQTPAYTGETPVKPADAQYTYTFSGWTPEITAVTGEATYTAAFTSAKRSYTITWLNDDGSLIDTTNVEYGVTPTHADPVKEATAEYTYTFAGWDPAIVPVTGEATYRATFTAVKRSYTITWLNDDGSLIDTTTVEYGVVPTHADPVKAPDAQYSYTFAGWSPAPVPVTGDASYTATYTQSANLYTITFVNYDGTVLQSSEFAYGDTPVYSGATPVKPADAQYSYTFSGWTPEIAEVTGAATYTAAYTQSVNSYTITFVNYDGTVLQSSEFAYGDTPVYSGATPVKPADAQHSYTFEGWTPELVSVTGEATYTAVFTSELNAYTVTWRNWNGDLLLSENYEYGETPVYKGETPVREGDAQYSYTFVGWEPETAPVTDNAEYTAKFVPTTKTYTITWANYNGELLLEQTYSYGDTPAYPAADPVKPADAQYAYTFAGWSPEIAPVTGNMTYVAVFTETVNKYTVTWIIDGVETSEEYEYGATPVHADPVKEATAQYTYTFAGWTPEIVPVTGNATYTATFTETVNKYTVTWVIDGVESTEEYEYGATPVHADPVKEATAQYTYTFSGWTPEIVEVTGEATYTATFTETVNKYTVTWVIDGVESTEEYEYGATPVHADPVKEATAQYTYTFAGWTPEIVPVTGNATYTATFTETVNKYTVTWVIDGVESTEEYEYGATPVHADPVKEATAQYTYTFAGWTPEIVPVTGNATYTATFTETVNKYMITFVNYDGEVLQASEVEYGTMPAYNGETPTKEATAQYTYTFAGWTPEIVEVTGEATYTATFTETVNKYTITWVIDGVESTEEYEYGATPVHADPVKPATAQYTYTFAGWTPEIVEVTGEATYTATFTETVNKYTITWVIDGVESTEEYEYGATPVHADPVKPATAQYTYTFAGWTPEIVPVTGNATYTATFTETVNKYTVTWVIDGVESTEEYEYGATPVHADPVKEATAQHTYTFAGWTPEIVPVTGNATYTATFTETVNKYTVTWIIDGVETSEEYEYGATPVHADPVKPATAQYTYTFAGWTPEIVPVTGNATYTATFTETVNKYMITFVNYDGEVLQASEVEYGTMPAYNGETPTKEATAQYTYTFAGWTPEIVPVTGNATYTATFTETVNKYTVTFKDWDGTVLKTENVDYGSAATAPADPTRTGWTFTGWDADFGNITADLVVTAQYSINTHTVIFNINGEEYARLTFEYGAPVTAPEYTVPAGHTFSGWDLPDAMPDTDLVLEASLTLNTHTLRIEYVYSDGREAAQSYTATLGYGEEYEVESPVIPLYTADVPTVAGVMGDEDVLVTVTYSLSPLLGDANCDGQVTMADVTALIAKVMNAGDLSEQGMINADANRDGEVNILDAAAIYAIAFNN